MMNFVLATTASDGGVLRTLQDAWNQPDMRPALIAAAAFGLVFGCVLSPIYRRLWLAIKPRRATKSSST